MSEKNNSIIDINDLKAFWRVVSKNWYIVLVFAVIAMLAGYLYAYKLTNIYQARTQILLNANDQYNPQSVVSDNTGGWNAYYSNYIDNANQMRVIKSYDLIKQVVDKMDLGVSYFIVGRLRTQEFYRNMPYVLKVKYINPALYEQKMHFKIINAHQYELSYSLNNQDYHITGFFDKETVNPDMKIMVSNTGEITKESSKELGTIDYLIQVHNPMELVHHFQNELDVENPQYTNVLQVSLDDVIPQRAIAFLDTLSGVYIQTTLKSQYEINKNTLYYIDKQMQEVSHMLDSTEQQLQDYQESKNILDINKEETNSFDKLTTYDQQKTTLELQVSALNDLEQYIIEDKDPEFLPPSIYVNSSDAFLQKSVGELYSMQINRNAALNNATANSPQIRDIDQKIRLLKNNLLTYIGNSRKAFNEKISDVDKEIQQNVGDIKMLPAKQRGMMAIQRKLKVNENIYSFLLEKKANTVISRASIVPRTKVIETALSMGIVKPDRKKIYYIFLGAGVFVSLILVFIRMIFFEKIESIEELKYKTSLPVLGEILFAPQIKELVLAIESDPKSPITESFRTIRTNLQYMAPNRKSKIILITSNNPGEGKTFCSINLAAILAKANKKVLLLELDLHKPRVQKALNMSSNKGISTILIGGVNVADTVLNSEVENLDVILSGPLPPNASELILSEHLDELIEYGREHYEYVIIDTPPVALISDGLVLMKKTDVNLFVLDTKYTYKDSINHAHEIVAFNKYSNFGFILNGVKRKKSKYYYNKYAYGYGYGYGYGYKYGGYGDDDKSGK